MNKKYEKNHLIPNYITKDEWVQLSKTYTFKGKIWRNGDGKIVSMNDEWAPGYYNWCFLYIDKYADKDSPKRIVWDRCRDLDDLVPFNFKSTGIPHLPEIDI